MTVELVRKMEMTGLSTDTKPTNNIWPGAEFYETDTKKKYVFNGTDWVLKIDNVALTGRNAIKTVIIANGESLSGEIDLEGYSMLAIEMPAAWDTANLTFQAASTSGGTFQDVYDDSGFEVTITADASRVITIDINALKLAGLRYIKVRSGTSATPVNQTADRTMNIICKN